SGDLRGIPAEHRLALLHGDVVTGPELLRTLPDRHAVGSKPQERMLGGHLDLAADTRPQAHRARVASVVDVARPRPAGETRDLEIDRAVLARRGPLAERGDGNETARREHVRGPGDALPRPRRPGPADGVEVADGVDVLLLRHALRRDDALVRGDEDRVEEDVAQLRVAVAREDAERVVDVGRVDRVAAL